jgi:hypothetical protein
LEKKIKEKRKYRGKKKKREINIKAPPGNRRGRLFRCGSVFALRGTRMLFSRD